jgi:hypothetical protein
MSVLIENRTPFALKIYRAGEDGEERFCNQLGAHQTYVQKVRLGDRISARLLLQHENLIKTVTVSDTHHHIVIDHSDMRSKVRREADAGDLGIPEHILCDLYEVDESGTWELSGKRINPNEAPFIDTLPGQLFVGTAPDDRDSVLFWTHVYDPGDQDEYSDEISYNAHVIRNFLRGTVSSNGVHTFEDERVTQERLLPSGVPQLFEGEVLVYQSPNYDQGAPGLENYFWIFKGNVADISIYAPPIQVDQGWILPSITAQSFIPGPGTVVTVFNEKDQQGEAHESDKRIGNVPFNSFSIQELTKSADVGLRMLTDLSEDTDHEGKDVARFRTTLIFNNPSIKDQALVWPKVKMQAEIPSKISINRQPEQDIDPVEWSQWITPSQHGRVVVSQPTLDKEHKLSDHPELNKLHTPALFFKTDGMEEHHVVAFHPSLALHEKLQHKFTNGQGNIKSAENRKALGIEADSKKLPDSACDAVQHAALNLSRMAVPNYSQDSHAVHARHQVNGSQMAHSQWHFSKDKDGNHRYVEMTKTEHKEKLAEIHSLARDGIQHLNRQVEESFFGDIAHFVENVGEKLVHIVVSVVDQVEHAVEAVVHYVEDGINKAVKFLVQAVEAIGALIKSVFDAIKLAIEKLIEFIMFLIHMIIDIVKVYHNVSDTLNGQIDTWKHYITNLLDKKAIEDKIRVVEDLVLSPFSQHAKKKAHHSSSPLKSAMEKLEWLFHLISEVIGELTSGSTSKQPIGFLLTVEGTIIKTVEELLEDAIETMISVVENPQDASEDLEELGVNLVKDVFNGVNEIVEEGVDFLKENVDALEAGSVWDIPFVSYIKSILPDLTPVSIISVIYAVPVGIVYALEKIDPDDLTLSTASNVTDAQMVFSAVGTFTQTLTGPFTTFNLSSPEEEPGTLVQACEYLSYVMDASNFASGLYKHTYLDIAEGIAACLALFAGYNVKKSATENHGAETVNKVIAVLSAVKSVLTILQAATDDDQKDTVRAAMSLEGIAGILTLSAFTKNEEVVVGAMVAEAALYFSAGCLRTAHAIEDW